MGSIPSRSTIIMSMKKFFTLQLKKHNENLPAELGKRLLIKESPFINYLFENNALAVRHMRSRATLEFYGETKHLTIAIMKYKTVLSGTDPIKFIELFIRNQLLKKYPV